jgi:DNA-directed RNA polymerase specialized sigma24 family protein
MSAKDKRSESGVALMPSAQELADAGILTERQAEIWMLREVEELSTAEAADMIGLAESTVGSHLATARDRVEEVRETAMLLNRAERNRDQLAEIRGESQ